MTPEEAIQQLEFDRAMILFDSLTGEEITPEILKLINKENYLTYIADGIAIEALKEVRQYREIGTVEECREAVEKQKPKKILPLTYELLLEDGWRHKCPNCGCAVGENIYHPDVTKDYEFCSMCGQAIYE